MDDNYQVYLNRVARLTLLDAYQSGVQHIQESPKYKLNASGIREPVPFPGYTIITPPWEEETDNHRFYKNLQDCQQQLLKELDPELLVPVPPESFHVTLADLIWDDGYRHAKEKPDFDELLRNQISQSFEVCRSCLTSHKPIRWQLLGLMLRTRALGVCLAPKDEESYEQIVQLRRAIYQNHGLMGLGIEQQYHFTAHVTLGYFGEIKPDLDGKRLSQTLYDFNLRWVDAEPQELIIQRAELRFFDDMTKYRRADNWPVLEF